MRILWITGATISFCDRGATFKDSGPIIIPESGHAFLKRETSFTAQASKVRGRMELAGGPTAWEHLIAAAAAGLVTTLLATRWLIRRLQGTKLVGIDLHKPGRPLIPEMGGLAVIAGFYVGITLLQLIAPDGPPSAYLHASLVAIFGAGFVGLMDDLFDLRQRVKALLPFLFAIPLGIVAFRDPDGGTILLYADVGALIILAIPFGITSAANAANMLEGFNGLGAGLGIIMCVAMIGLAFLTGDTSGLYFVVPLLGALLAFLYFNRFPARVFPGDSMTLFVGATIAAAAIVSHQKTYGALLFLPMIAEFFLKLRGRFQGENYGEPDSEGNLRYSGKTESLAHVLMKRHPMKEWQVVGALWTLEAVVGAGVLVAAVLRV